MSEHFLVTGAMGCIGAWTIKQLLDEGAAVTTFDLVDNPYRLRLVMDDPDIDKVNFVQGDITDFEQFERAVVDNGITHIIHLAALQVPFCRADPVLGEIFTGSISDPPGAWSNVSHGRRHIVCWYFSSPIDSV